MNTKTLYFIKHLALVALVALGLVLVPSVGTVAAQKGERQVEVATSQQISYALNLKSVSSVAVYSETEIDGKGGSTLTNGFRATGGNEVNRKDLSAAFSAINQLPCTEIEGADLSGKTFTPGVYCLASANLSSHLVMDAQGDLNANFVFRIAGSLNAKSGASIGLANGAQAGSIFFVTNDSARLESGVDFKGSILARNSIGVGADSTVDGRVLSVKGEVSLGSNAVLGPQQTGVLEICKETTTTESGLDLIGVNANNQLVRFNSNNPEVVSAPVTITGAAAGTDFRGIDFRPATAVGTSGMLYALGTTPAPANVSSLYTINPVTGVATLVGPLGVPTEAGSYGFDFNPTMDRIRVIGSNGENYSVDPNTGVATTQTAINPATASVNAAGYTNSVAGATTTTLYTINITNDTLNIQNPAASGTQTVVGPLGVNASGPTGFDISPITNTAVATLNNLSDTTSTLYRVNLTTGAATLVGTVATTAALRGLAIVPGSSTGLAEDNLANRIFRFSVAGLIAEVPVGQCSGPLVVPTGNQTIVELQTGRTLSGGTFNGNFQLVQVRTLGQTPASALVSANLPNFSAVFNVREGNIANQSRVEFTNRFAIVAIVEICKEGLDSGVTGFFNFTIDGLRSGDTAGNTAGVIGSTGATAGNVGGTLNPFTVPVGQCTGPIAVVAGSDDDTLTPGTVPPNGRRFGQVRINELPRSINGQPAFLCTNVFTAPGTVNPVNRLVGFTVLANGGCFADVTVVAGTTGPQGGVDSTGGTAVQTTAFFNNRTAPAALKICKIAGPGITVGQNFNFTVTGTMPLAPVAAPGGTVPVPAGAPAGAGTQVGTAQTGSTLQGGTITTQSVNVIAGPVENGGFCNDVAGLFVVDTAATVTENDATANLGEVRVSRITSSSGIIAAGPNEIPAGTTGGTATTTNPTGNTSRAATAPNTITLIRQPGVPFFPARGNTPSERTVTVPVTREVAEVEFVNIAFLPVPLKVCKVGVGTAQGQTFTFTVTTDTVGGLLAPFTTTIPVIAGPQAPANSTQQNGNCDFVTGPFAGATINGLNSFNFGSQVTIQETGFGSTVINAGGITSPTGGVIANTGTRTAVISSLINGVNEVQFVNTPTSIGIPPAPKPRKRARFF